MKQHILLSFSRDIGKIHRDSMIEIVMCTICSCSAFKTSKNIVITCIKRYDSEKTFMNTL